MPKERLDSWKNIAEYLERSLRTVQRWHAFHGLPVRHLGGSKGSVFAYTDEIDRWLISLSEEVRNPPLSGDEALEHRKKRSLELTANADLMWEARSEGNVQTISGLYRKAIDENIGNAAALTGMANTMIFCAMHGIIECAVGYARAQDALRRLPPEGINSPEARCAAAWLGMVCDRNWRQAQAGFEEVLTKQPCPSFAVSGRALLYVAEGDVQQASVLAWEAWKRNPLACSLGALLGWIQYLSGDLEHALDLARQVRASGGYGKMAALVEAFSLLQNGSAAASLRSLEALAGEFPGSQTLRGVLGYAYASSGQEEKAGEILRDLERHSEMKKRNNGYALALILLGLNRRQEAINWLETAYSEGVLFSLAYRCDPILKPLQGDPRFDALLRKSGPVTERSIDVTGVHAAEDSGVSAIAGSA